MTVEEKIKDGKLRGGRVTQVIADKKKKSKDFRNRKHKNKIEE